MQKDDRPIIELTADEIAEKRRREVEAILASPRPEGFNRATEATFKRAGRYNTNEYRKKINAKARAKQGM